VIRAETIERGAFRGRTATNGRAVYDALHRRAALFEVLCLAAFFVGLAAFGDLPAP
jgi:hypothetical protein